MKQTLPLTLMILTLTGQVLAGRPVIYGEDGRREVFESTPMQQRLAKSAASMIPTKHISPSRTLGMSVLTQRTLAQWLSTPAEEKLAAAPKISKIFDQASQGMKFCASERFTDQPNPGMCSGFLIAPDLLVTAGHCVVTPRFCEDNKWIFDFKVNEETGEAGKDIKNENIYSCKQILSGALDMNLGSDFGLVQLDRDVTDREPLAINAGKFVAEGEEILVIGGPSGLPLKVTTGANVRTSTHPFYFNANLDTFQGNSGSAVFNAKTGVVEGILVRGEQDFEMDSVKMCLKAKQCADNSCRGEDVSRMTSMPEVIVQSILSEAIANEDLELLESALSLGTWVDFYGKDKVTALMVASAAGNSAIVARLLRRADVKLVDVDGNSALHYLAKNLSADSAQALTVLLRGKAPLELKNREGKTPLLVAASELNLEGVKLLLKAGANKNATDEEGVSVLSGFVAAGDAQAIRELAAMGIALPAIVE